MARPVPLLAALCAGFLAVFPFCARAWNLPIDGPPSSVETRYDVFAPGADARFWAADINDGTTTFNYYPNVASLPAVSISQVGLRVQSAAMTPKGELITMLRDGSASARCRVVKYGTDGQLRWDKLYTDLPCGLLAPGQELFLPAADGTWWLKFGGRLVHFEPDEGRQLDYVDLDYLEGTVAAIDPQSGVSYSRILTGTGEYLIVASDRKGALRWRKPFSSFDQIVVAPDGTLRVFGATISNWYVAALGADGGMRWSRTIDPHNGHGPFTGLQPPLVDANGAVYIHSGPADAVIKVDANGRIAWRASVAALGARGKGGSPTARFAPNGDLLVSLENRFARLDPEGAIRYSKALPSSKIRAVAFPDDNGVLLMLESTDGLNRLVRLGPGGEALPPLAGIEGREHATASQATLADGSAFVWTNASGGSRDIVHVTADGNVAWRQTTAGTWSMPVFPQPAGGAIAASADRVCTLDARQRPTSDDVVLTCRRSFDGVPLWEIHLLEGSPRIDYTHAQLNIAADGTVTAWYDFVEKPGDDGITSIGHARVSATGVVTAAKVISAGTLMPVSPADAAYALVDDTLHGPDGSARYRLPASPGRAVTIAPDGSAVVAQRETGDARGNLVRYDSAGHEAWSARVAVGNGGPASPAIGTDAVYMASGGADGSNVMTRYSLADGAVAWQRELRAPGTHDETRARQVVLAGDVVFGVGSSQVALDVDAYDAISGDVRARRRLGCRKEGCFALAPQAGSERINVIDSSNAASSVIGWRATPAQNGLVRIDQSGLTGGWWATYANGEGYVIDYLPASRTLFMPWFTFRQEKIDDASGQRWYVIQGAVPQNATRVTLPITQATGGMFGAGPPPVGEIVGEAILSFTDCSTGTLEYDFHEGVNGGQKGIISLTRLTPATQPCTLADGATQPAAGARAPANGFDARMSGSWYDAANEGQGLEVVIQPNGIYFVPWFTFDPEGAPDDPERQRWFTLQGSLEGARNGVVEAPIVQGVGGAFDRVATSNVSLVGTSTFTLAGCDRGRLDYRFDDDDAAGAMRGRSGTIDLVKAGGCPP